MTQFLYVLPALACPVGMGLMMWLMMRGNKKPAVPSSDPREQELAALRKEIADLRENMPNQADREHTR